MVLRAGGTAFSSAGLNGRRGSKDSPARARDPPALSIPGGLLPENILAWQPAMPGVFSLGRLFPLTKYCCEIGQLFFLLRPHGRRGGDFVERGGV